jgi:ankyrin repeat protein
VVASTIEQTPHPPMGVPFNEPPGDEDQLPHPPADDPPASETESSSSEENDDDLDEEEEHGYGNTSTDSEEWEDPSEGGILTLVFRAAEHGDEAELEQLLPSLSVSVNTPGADDDTPLHLASLYGHVGCARILLDAGAQPDLPDEDGAIPLHDAAAGGYTELVELLLDRGAEASINAADSDGDTPLHNAARGGNIDVVRLLLQREADPTVKNNALKTPAGLVSGDTELHDFLTEAERMFTEMMEARAAAGEAGEGEDDDS